MPFPPPTEKQTKIIWASVTGLGIAVLVSLVGLLIWTLGLVLKVLSPVLWPLAIAGIMAYLLDPVVDFFERRKMRRQRAIVLVFVLFAVAVLGLFGSIVPRLVFETRNLVERMPVYAEQMQKDATEWMASKRFSYLFHWREKLRVLVRPSEAHTNATAAVSAPPGTLGSTNPPPATPAVSPDEAKASEIAQAVFTWLGKVLPAAGSWLLAQLSRITAWFEILIGLALVPVFIFYFLLEKQGIEAGWTRYLPLRESWLKDELVFVLNSINNYLIVFFRGQVVIALCDGVLLSIGFLILGLNFAVLIGLMAGLLGIIPYLGTILTIVPAIILAAVQFQDWFHPLMVIVIYSVVHMLEGFVIAPKIQGDRVGLHPLTIIVALLVGTTLLGGILGGILAIPLTAAARVIMFRYIWRKPSSEVLPSAELAAK